MTSRPPGRMSGLRPNLARHPLAAVLIAVLVAVVGTTAVVVMYARGLLPAAGPFVTLALLPLLVLLRVGYLRRRVFRQRSELTVLLGSLLRLATAERSRSRDQRASRASDRSLAETVARLEIARDQLRANRAESVDTVGALLAGTVGWSADAPLTQQLGRAVSVAAKLRVTWSDVEETKARF